MTDHILPLPSGKRHKIKHLYSSTPHVPSYIRRKKYIPVQMEIIFCQRRYASMQRGSEKFTCCNHDRVCVCVRSETHAIHDDVIMTESAVRATT